MSTLKVFAEDNAEKATIETTDHSEIAGALAAKGVRFERWQATAEVVAGGLSGNRDCGVSNRYRPPDRGGRLPGR